MFYLLKRWKRGLSSNFSRKKESAVYRRGKLLALPEKSGLIKITYKSAVYAENQVYAFLMKKKQFLLCKIKSKENAKLERGNEDMNNTGKVKNLKAGGTEQQELLEKKKLVIKIFNEFGIAIPFLSYSGMSLMELQRYYDELREEADFGKEHPYIPGQNEIKIENIDTIIDIIFYHGETKKKHYVTIDLTEFLEDHFVEIEADFDEICTELTTDAELKEYRNTDEDAYNDRYFDIENGMLSALESDGSEEDIRNHILDKIPEDIMNILTEEELKEVIDRSCGAASGIINTRLDELWNDYRDENLRERKGA